MRILVAFYSKTGTTERVALALKEALEEKGHNAELAKILPKEELKAAQYKKDGKDIELKNPVLDMQKFDLVIVGTPVWGFCPTPIVLSYLRGLQNTSEKKFALFATCTVLPGTTIQRMASILSTKGGTVTSSLTIRSIFPLDGAKLREAKAFAGQLAGRQA